MSFFELIYKDLLIEILENGNTVNNKKIITGKTIKFNFNEGFPMFSVDKEKIHHVIHELMWQLSGCTNTKYLIDNGVNIFDDVLYEKYKIKSKELGISFNLTQNEFIEQLKLQKTNSKWVDEFGDIENTIGKDWKDGQQIEKVIDNLKNIQTDDNHILINSNSDSFVLYLTKLKKEEIIEYCKKSKKIVENEKWFSSLIDDPDFYYNDVLLYNDELNNFNPPKYKLSLVWYKNKIDVYKNFKHDYLFYGLLLQLICQQVNMIPHELIGSFGILYLNNDEIDQVNVDISNEIKILPKLTITPTQIFGYKLNNFIIEYLFFS